LVNTYIQSVVSAINVGSCCREKVDLPILTFLLERTFLRLALQ
jgi:hypothetical protein